MKTGANGAPYYDRDKFKPELAEDMNVGDMSVTFKLKKNATFQDGTPVTAKDVKWSLDRAVTVGGFPTFQMKAGSLEKPEQFVVVDDHTVRVDFLRKDRLTIPDLAVIVPCVINSELVKKNATDKDPWGLEYTKQNTAGSGAYKVAKWTAGTEVIFERNDKWAGGPLPKVKRVIWRMVPSAGNRRALLERGDADISYDLPNKDFAELKNVGKLIDHLDAVQQRHPVHRHEREDAAVRQSQGAPGGRLCACPTRRSWTRCCSASQSRCSARRRMQRRPKSPGRSRTNTTPTSPRRSSSWPRPAIRTASRRRCRSTSALPASTSRLCVLTQESLAQIGIKTTINKMPGANWRTELNKKTMPLYTNVFSGWLDYPEYFFIWCYHGQNSVFNTMSYQSKEMDALDRRRARRRGRPATRRPTTRT